MNAEAIFNLVVFVFVVGIGGTVVWFTMQTRREFVAWFANHPQFRAEASALTLFTDVKVHTRPGARFAATMVATSTSGKNSIDLWRITVRGIGLGERTTLSLSREGFLGGLREAIGFSDVKVGDPAFDDAFTIRGSDADVVRGALNERTRNAIRAFFGGETVRSFDLRRDGTLEIETTRDGWNEKGAAQHFDAVLDLAGVLDDAASATALPAPSRELLTSVGASSGTPFALPTSTTRRE